MSADVVLVYFGLRYKIELKVESERLEKRDDLRLSAARRVKLQAYWGRETDGESNFLLIGTEIGRFGVEAASRAELSEGEGTAIIEETRRKLREAGLEGDARFHFQLETDH